MLAFFDDRQIFKDDPNENVMNLSSNNLIELNEVIKLARANIENKIHAEGGLEFIKLKQGYKLFNALRGIEYIVDLEYNVPTNAKHKSTYTSLIRVHVIRPIHSTELLDSVIF